MRCSVSSISLAYSDGVGNSACHTVVVWFAPHRISNDGCTCQSTQVTEVVTVKGQTKTTPKRRYRTVEEERRIVEETLVEGASVARVARAHGVNANQVFAWRKLYLAGRLNGNRAIQLLPVRVSKSSLSLATTSSRECSPSVDFAESTPDTIHLELRHAQVRIEGSADPALLRVVAGVSRAMIGLPANTRIWISAGVTNLRRGFTGLSRWCKPGWSRESILGTRVRVSRAAWRSD